MNQHLKQKHKLKKYTLFLEKKLIKKKNCLLNELNFITDYLKFL